MIYFIPNQVFFLLCLHFALKMEVSNSARLLTTGFPRKRFTVYRLTGILVSHANVQKL